MSRLPMIVVAAVRHSTAAVLTCFFVSPMHSDTIGTTSSIADRVRRERVEREGARLPRLLAVHRTEQRALDHAERIARERADEVTRRGLGRRAGQRLLVACEVEQLGEHRDEVRDAGGAEVVEAGLDAEGAALIVDGNQRRDDRERVEALRRKRRTVDLSKISQQMALIQCCK